LNFRDLENLFNAKIDHKGSREIENVADDHAVSAIFRECSGPSAAEENQVSFSYENEY
jgi:hypothetical protein